MTLEQDRVMEKLRENGMVPFNAIKSATELNAMRDLCKRGLARFTRFSKDNCGYVLVGHPFLDEVAQ